MTQSLKLNVPPVIPSTNLEAFIMEFNRIFSEAGVTWHINRLIDQAFTTLEPTYGTNVQIDASQGGKFLVAVTNNVAFTIANPLNPMESGIITYTIRNTSGGAMGAVTWGTEFKMSAWVSPATGFSRSISFARQGQFWYEVSRTPADVPN